MTRQLRWPLVIVLSSAALGAVVVAGGAGPLRLALALWFLLVCTGMSFAPLLPTGSRPPWALAVALSLGIDTAVTTTLLVAGAFSMTAGLLALQAICLAGCLLQVRRWAGGRPAAEVRFH